MNFAIALLLLLLLLLLQLLAVMQGRKISW